jgi:peroxin-11B
MSLLANHPTVLRSIKLLDTTIGRDKLMRTVQYFARFLSYYLYRQGYSKQAIALWKTLQLNLGLSRKLFRIGKPLSHAKIAATSYHNKTADPVIRASTIGRNLGFVCYLTLDSLVWLHGSRVHQFPADKFARIQQTANRFWLAGLVSSILGSLYKYQQARATTFVLAGEQEKDAASIKKVEADKCAAVKQLVWDILDSTIPLSALKIVDLDDGVVGLAGLITSVMGLKQVW